MKKIDMHVHYSGMTPPPMNFPGAEPPKPVTAEMLMDFLQEQGIEKAVILTGSESRNGGMEPTRQVVAQYPDFFSWMCNFDPVDQQLCRHP